MFEPLYDDALHYLELYRGIKNSEYQGAKLCFIYVNFEISKWAFVPPLVLGIKDCDSGMLGKNSSTELYPQPSKQTQGFLLKFYT